MVPPLTLITLNPIFTRLFRIAHATLPIIFFHSNASFHIFTKIFILGKGHKTIIHWALHIRHWHVIKGRAHHFTSFLIVPLSFFRALSKRQINFGSKWLFSVSLGGWHQGLKIITIEISWAVFSNFSKSNKLPPCPSGLHLLIFLVLLLIKCYQLRILHWCILSTPFYQGLILLSLINLLI